MADSTGSNNSLDDFFKKKDKSRKSKGRKPILPVAPPESTEDPDKFPDEEPQTTVATKEPVINIKLGDEVSFGHFIHDLWLICCFLFLHNYRMTASGRNLRKKKIILVSEFRPWPLSK